MLVYRSASSTEQTPAKLNRVRALVRQVQDAISPAHDDVRTVLIEVGELEAGVVDAICGVVNTVTPVLSALRRASVCAGHLVRTSWSGEDCRPYANALAAELERLEGMDLPREVQVSIPEGYAWYALYPEMYLRAAGRFCEDRNPDRAVVIGIRAIGTGLSGAVAAVLENLGWTVDSYTVRPAGHPFDRRVSVSPELSHEWQSQHSGFFLIVDEGPGLSGSSFAATARAVREIAGVPDSRIVLFPSWSTDGSQFVNRQAAEEWRRYRNVCSPFEEILYDSRSPFRSVLTSGLHDVSGGKWREIFLHSEENWPAVQPEHECRKYLSGGSLMKFAGLGDYGRRKHELANATAARGFSPAVTREQGGFLFNRIVSGRPLSRASRIEHDLLDRMADYLAWRKLSFPCQRSLSFDDLAHMIETNAAERLGTAAPEWSSGLRHEFEDRGACAVDGRMLPHEWVVSNGEYFKTDAVDHHADHFYPGDADIVWDLAATCVEFALDGGARRSLVRRYQALTGDMVSAELFQFYETAWLSFRAGYASMAAGAVSQVERSRWQNEGLRYEHLLATLLAVRSEHLQVSV